MSMNIKIKEFLGESYSIEDAILLREIVKNNLDTGVTLDFDGLERIPSTFLICLFTDLINAITVNSHSYFDIIQRKL